jgi:hypothetical protein
MPDPNSFDSSFGVFGTIIKIGFVVIGLLFVCAIIRATIRGRRGRKILRDAGLDPMMARVQMEARLANSALLAPAKSTAKSVEERLAELESLHGRGLITGEELHEARAKILAG